MPRACSPLPYLIHRDRACLRIAPVRGVRFIGLVIWMYLLRRGVHRFLILASLSTSVVGVPALRYPSAACVFPLPEAPPYTQSLPHSIIPISTRNRPSLQGAPKVDGMDATCRSTVLVLPQCRPLFYGLRHL
jgi:hypothetical protein